MNMPGNAIYNVLVFKIPPTEGICHEVWKAMWKKILILDFSVGLIHV